MKKTSSNDENVKTITVDNEKSYKPALTYFLDSSDAIEVKKTDLPLKGVKGNIYALYVDKVLMYIGESQKEKINGRLNQHLHECPPGTNSKKTEVEKAFLKNQKVSYKTLLIEPDYERYSLETYLIQKIEKLEWNIRDKGRKKLK